MLSSTLLGQLRRWEGKWVHVYAADCGRSFEEGVRPIRGKLVDIGTDCFRVRQADGYEVLFSAACIYSVGLVRDQERAEVEAMEVQLERTG